MSDQSKITLALMAAAGRGGYSDTLLLRETVETVESLIRDAAERAWRQGFAAGAGVDPISCVLPVDFPLVAPKEVDR